MTIDEPVMLIRISRLYRENMTADELYEATRGVWKVGLRREGAKYAFAVHEGTVREVYEIAEWDPAGTTSYVTRDEEKLPLEGRWEFRGTVAPPETRRVYVGASVSDYFKQGQQNPVTYVNC
jgi:hypothetical protein